MKALLWSAAAFALVGSIAVSAERPLAKWRAGAAATADREISYGSDPKQKLDYWRAPGTNRPPIIIFVHGGGWSIGDKAQGTGTKSSYYNGLGYAFASLNYRLVPNVTPDDQAKDVAAAIAHLRSNARRLGFDPNRVYVMGHSAGAHLAALVSANTRYLDGAGVPVSAISGTILLDGAGYDVVKQMPGAQKIPRLGKMYDAAFTQDRATQARLSPITYTSAPNSPRWLILHVANRKDSASQSQALGQALSSAGATISVKAVPNSNHMSINQDAGKAGTIVGAEIAAFIKR
jgi:arylformamidase